MTDRELIEWVAEAKVGMKYPLGYTFQSIILELVDQGVMPMPEVSKPMNEVADDAIAASKQWLIDHPGEPSQEQSF